MFVMTGVENEVAAFIGSINIRGKMYDIPIMRRGCIDAQEPSLMSRYIN